MKFVSWGCAVCSATMAINKLKGTNISPITIAKKYVPLQNIAYSKNRNISIPQVVRGEGLEYETISLKNNPGKIKDYLSSDSVIIVHVAGVKGTKKPVGHYLVVVGYENNKYKLLDPGSNSHPSANINDPKSFDYAGIRSPDFMYVVSK